jgi:hypothetical protein
MAREKVGMEVGLEHMGNGEVQFASTVEVQVDITLRIDYYGVASFLVAHQI